MAEEKGNIPDDIEAPEPINHVPSQMGEIVKDEYVTHDAVFGEVTEEGPNYRSLGWLGTVALMMKTQIGLGVLSVPSVFDSVGLDAGGLMFGRVGKEVFGTAFCLFLIVTISVGIQDRPSSAPQVGPWSSEFKTFNNPSFAQGVSAVSSLIFACSATPAYFAIAAEMRDPRFFTRALVHNTLVQCTWLSCTFGCTVIAYLIPSGIPFFNSLVSLIGALLGASLAYQPTGCMWFYNWSRRDTRHWRWMFMACWSVLIIIIGSFLTVAGTYGSIVSIVDSLAEDGGSKP
ncbi:uncharacterized protein KD926_001904 [Aspergillus affinis]|uniref:uncharacterized protein n=1 Tax=Aspergillus affinis TaxID=1070780 RepID=UPI0022FDD736|nr:uncharacterized protein KD926_001904 [Aspergillus affinis]KAI9044081.1 hypothetical protein KD926_001904 [Aspergillus affinis]